MTDKESQILFEAYRKIYEAPVSPGDAADDPDVASKMDKGDIEKLAKYKITDPSVINQIKSGVIDYLKQIGVEPHFIAEYVGQTHGSMTMDRYGKGYNPDILYNKCVKRIVYQTSQKRSIDFLSLKLDWKKILGL